MAGIFQFWQRCAKCEMQVKAILKERSGLGWAETVVNVDAAKPDVIASTALHPVPAPPDARPKRESEAELMKDVSQLLYKLSGEDPATPTGTKRSLCARNAWWHNRCSKAN
jgi:hypothetical protein